MQLTETIKLYTNADMWRKLISAMQVYINTVNALVQAAAFGTDISAFSSKDVDAALPSAVKAQCARDARSIVKKHYKACRQAVKQLRKHPGKKIRAPKLPLLKRPVLYVNNQNFKLSEDAVELPLWLDGKCRRVRIAIKLTDRQKDLLLGVRFGMLRIVYKNKKLCAQITYSIAVPDACDDGNVMGVDLGIKCPAVSYCSDGSIHFFGNGRKNKYMRLHYKYLRKRLQKKKKLKAVCRIDDKEQRIMRDIDHKLSKQIIEEAVKHNVKTIKLECLTNIRSATRTSRKNNPSLHTWSFYRLAGYIEYKAAIAGIRVVYVNPMFTSQACPVCGKHNHADDRHYECKCGYHGHRDIVGAINICRSTEYVGDSDIRRTA